MKKVILFCLLAVVSSVSSAANLADVPIEVKKVHDGWDIDKVYVMKDADRGKWCYVVSTNGGVTMQCFDLKEENK